MQADLVLKPSMAIEFITHVGVNIPAFARSGVQMISNIYHESGIEARVGLRAGQLKLSIPAPKTPTKLFSFRYLDLDKNIGSFKIASSFPSCFFASEW